MESYVVDELHGQIQRKPTDFYNMMRVGHNCESAAVGARMYFINVDHIESSGYEDLRDIRPEAAGAAFSLGYGNYHICREVDGRQRAPTVNI